MTESGSARVVRAVDTGVAADPTVGAWLWAIQDSRARLLAELAQLTPAMVDWVPPDGGSSVGTLLYHMAGIEADWLYVEVLGQDPWPEEVTALFSADLRDGAGHLLQFQGETLEQHLARLSAVRARLAEAFRAMPLAEFRRARSLERYDVTPEWVLHHLTQHEAEHRGQIGALRALAAHALGA